MLSTFSVDHIEQKISTMAVGRITYQEIIDSLLDRENKHILTYSELFDARYASADISSSQIEKLEFLMRGLGYIYRLGRSAIIVNDDLTYGMFQTLVILLHDVVEIKVFRDKARANAWLDNKRFGMN